MNDDVDVLTDEYMIEKWFDRECNNLTLSSYCYCYSIFGFVRASLELKEKVTCQVR